MTIAAPPKGRPNSTLLPRSDTGSSYPPKPWKAPSKARPWSTMEVEFYIHNTSAALMGLKEMYRNDSYILIESSKDSHFRGPPIEESTVLKGVESTLQVPGNADITKIDPMQNPVIYMNSAIMRAFSLREILSAPGKIVSFAVKAAPETVWISASVLPGSLGICIKSLQLTWEMKELPHGAAAVWKKVSSVTGWVERGIAAPFLILLLPWIRHRRSKDATFKRIAILLDNQKPKLWVVMLYVSTGLGIAVNMFRFHNATDRIEDNWVELFINLAVALTMLVEILVRLPLHLAHESADRSIRSCIVGIFLCLLFIVRLPRTPLEGLTDEYDRTMKFLGIVPYALAEGTNLTFFSLQLAKLVKARQRSGRVGGYTCRSVHAKLASPAHREYVSDLLDHKAPQLAKTHHMDSYKPSAIVRHLKSRHSSLRNRSIPLSLLTAVSAIAFIAWVTALDLFEDFLKMQDYVTCNLMNDLPYINYAFNVLFGIGDYGFRVDLPRPNSIALLYRMASVGAGLGLVVLFLLVLYLLGGILMAFDTDLAKLRRGDYTQVNSRVELQKRSMGLWVSAGYLAAQIGFGFISLWFLGKVVMSVFENAAMMVVLPSTWYWILHILQTFSPIFVAYAMAFVVALTLRRIFFVQVYMPRTGFWVSNPGHFAQLHYLVVPMTLLISILSFFGKILAGFVSLGIYSIRIDATNQLGALRIFDPTAKVYACYLLAEHHHSNPINRTFIDLCRVECLRRAEVGGCSSAGDPETATLTAVDNFCKSEHIPLSPRSDRWEPDCTRGHRARLNWFLAYTLIRNPQLIVDRRHGHPLSNDLQKMAKAGLLKMGWKRLQSSTRSFSSMTRSLKGMGSVRSGGSVDPGEWMSASPKGKKM